MNMILVLCLYVTTDFFFSCSRDILLVQLHSDHTVHNVDMESGQCYDHPPDIRYTSLTEAEKSPVKRLLHSVKTIPKYTVAF